MQTIGSVLNKHNGIGPGFDFLRIALSLSVLLSHSVYISQGTFDQFDQPPIRLLHDSIIPMFFALSGFLITGSALRLKLKDFILNRSMRIVPALLVDIFISALILGPVFTVLPMREYLSDIKFAIYFTNIVGWIHYELPGVFLNNPTPNFVNGSLWTIPLEIGCYILMSFLIYFNFLKRRRATLFITFIIALLVTLSFWTEFDPTERGGGVVKKSISALFRLFFSVHEEHFLPSGEMLYIYFLVGSLFYLFRDKIIFSGIVFLGCIAILTIGAFNGFGFVAVPLQAWLYYPTIVYITVYIGLVEIPAIPIYRHGDYSYGIYLYGFPIQQAIVAVIPKLNSVILHFLLSVMLTSLIAIASWHFIEKPVLKLRRKFSFTARKGDAIQALPISEA